MSDKEIIDLLRTIKYEVLDLKVRVHAIEKHLDRQDRDTLEVVAASRRLMMTIEAVDEYRSQPDEDDVTPVQN